MTSLKYIVEYKYKMKPVVIEVGCHHHHPDI